MLEERRSYRSRLCLNIDYQIRPWFRPLEVMFNLKLIRYVAHDPKSRMLRLSVQLRTPGDLITHMCDYMFLRPRSHPSISNRFQTTLGTVLLRIPHFSATIRSDPSCLIRAQWYS
jgi:hypothetical protein